MASNEPGNRAASNGSTWRNVEEGTRDTIARAFMHIVNSWLLVHRLVSPRRLRSRRVWRLQRALNNTIIGVLCTVLLFMFLLRNPFFDVLTWLR
jgi:hypothetical protein